MWCLVGRGAGLPKRAENGKDDRGTKKADRTNGYPHRKQASPMQTV